MKRTSLSPLIAAVLAVSACLSIRHALAAEPAPAGEAKASTSLDPKKLRDAMESAGSEEKNRAGKAAQAIEAQAYAAARNTLEKLLAEGHLTPAQKELVNAYIAELTRLAPKKKK